MAWEFHNPQFVMETAPELPLNFMISGPWSGHRNFAYDLVRFVKPSTMVELGTHYGTSFFSFCQAVRDSKLPTICYAVDTWEGDAHSGYYGEEVYESVKTVNTREFSETGRLLRKKFDDAVCLFENGSIDLLHIDGYHTYEATLHNYSTWYPKLAENSIVLFHDIAVRTNDFGVHILWETLKEFPHLEFPHCYGLGVLFPKGVPKDFQVVLQQKDSIIEHYANQAKE
ncbi:class I SAM-dependent methyltransferase [Peribacillus simplex]|uniref:class I SAM-dependent methyltransferase n=1 Tax=Peribacillus simplex TaxID=1478 RepID=UPI0024C194B7|nr:class I SAM-dependent methyltransferase [Peribacillus simplex]WHY97947.1 class I SAM-dependent methyltransferase [Peribacillus simplex]